MQTLPEIDLELDALLVTWCQKEHFRTHAICKDRLGKSGRFNKVTGIFTPDALPKRNEPCVCGSGKKFKNCCGE